MVVLDDLASRVELPEVTIVGERVALARCRSLELDEHEDLVNAVEDCVRLKTGALARDSRNPPIFALPRRA
jgi:hypothetical protein